MLNKRKKKVFIKRTVTGDYYDTPQPRWRQVQEGIVVLLLLT